ncbi:hypothetical protein DFH06DRAFT_1472729 [Mycena polygramma]|nr:hypothetical protein DFH06DRAFT_1472729 [Mycena polygramma]
MSFSRIRPGDSKENPLIVDVDGYLNETPTRKGIIRDGPPSRIRQDTSRIRAARDAVSGAQRNEHGLRVQAARVAQKPQQRTAPAASTSLLAQASAELIIAASRNLPSDPDVIITGYRAAPAVPPVSAGTPNSTRPSTSGVARASPEIIITGSRILPSTPDVIVTDYHAAPAAVTGADIVARGARRMTNLLLSMGRRRRQDPPLTPDSLWLSAGRPTDYEPLKESHICAICRGVKDHPVAYKCGHSHCYVCIRISLETSWRCPECLTTMNCAPFRHYPEEAHLRDAYAGWGSASSSRALSVPRASSIVIVSLIILDLGCQEVYALFWADAILEDGKTTEEDDKQSETTISELDKVKAKLTCALHRGGKRWCYVMPFTSIHPGKHIPLGIEHVGLWARKVHDGEASDDCIHPPKVLNFDEMAELGRPGEECNARGGGKHALRDIDANAPASELHKRRREESDDDKDALTIFDVLRELDNKYPALNYLQDSVGMADGAIG